MRTTFRVQYKHNVGTCHGLCMHGSDIAPDRNLHPCSRAMVNTTNANKVMRRRYRQPTCHQRTPETLDTFSSLTGSSILHYKINWLQNKIKEAANSDDLSGTVPSDCPSLVHFDPLPMISSHHSDCTFNRELLTIHFWDTQSSTGTERVFPLISFDISKFVLLNVLTLIKNNLRKTLFTNAKTALPVSLKSHLNYKKTGCGPIEKGSGPIFFKRLHW